MGNSDGLIPPHGGYRRLRSFVVSLAAYDGTVIFCNRFISRRSRTHDQMVQAARSGVQNIAEGSVASGTSKKAELKLTGVAVASIEELIRDYEDYLRQNGLAVWDKDSAKVRAMRARLAGQLAPPMGKVVAGAVRVAPPEVVHDEKMVRLEELDRTGIFDEPLVAALNALQSATAEVCGNIMLCLSHQASYLTARQLERLERDFAEQGGFTERLYRYRKEHRRPSDDSD